MVVEDYKAEMLPQGRGIKGLYQVIELAGRTCYKSESMISEDSAEKFVKRMIDSKHYAMLEHGTVYLYRSSEEETDEFKAFVEKYRRNKYSCVNFNKYKGMYNVYITTNYRVIIENKWDEDMKYFSKFTQFHEPRRAVRFVLDVGVGREFTRHRVFSFAQESSRYCNYSKEKFGNSLHIIRPSYMKDIELGEYKTTGIGWIFTAIRCLFDGNLKFIRSIRKAERAYMQMIKDCHTPQEARCVLPMCTKSELVMTGFMKDWKHFFDLRFYGTTGAPHPDAKYVSEKLLNCLVFKRFDRRKKEKMFQ